MAWLAVSVGAVLAVMGLVGVLASRPTPGLGSKVEPRLDGVGHLLLAGCLLVNGGRDAANSEDIQLGALGTALGVAGIVVLIAARKRSVSRRDDRAGLA